MTQTNISTDDCWHFAGHHDKLGYGIIYGENNQYPAYRVMYEYMVGRIPDGLEIDHLCESPPCINPAHLEPVTHRENTLRYYRRRTHCKNGHEYTPDNTVFTYYPCKITTNNPKGEARRCRTCISLSRAKRAALLNSLR